jgi:hypothetical protein
MMLQLLTTSEDTHIKLDSRSASIYADSPFPVTGPTLSHFLEHNRNLVHLELSTFRLNADHCRAIDASTNVDLDLQLTLCFPTEHGEKVLMESIKQNRGPTSLFNCRFDARRLANAMRGSSRVNFLALLDVESVSTQAWAEFFQALAENEGIVFLILNFSHVHEKDWTTLWQTILRHPKLERISFYLLQYSATGTWRDAQKTLRSQAIVDALRVNTLLQHSATMHYNDCDRSVITCFKRLESLITSESPRRSVKAL